MEKNYLDYLSKELLLNKNISTNKSVNNMLKSKRKLFILIAVAALAVVAYVATKKIITIGNAKEYMLSNVALVVSNSDKCNAILQSFSELESKPIKLQFANKDQQSQFAVAHSDETLKNHSHAIVKQKTGDAVYRVGTGDFEFKGEKVDYVIVTSTDVKNPNQSFYKS